MADTPKIRLPYASTSHLRLVPANDDQDESAKGAESKESIYRGLVYAAENWHQWLAQVEKGGRTEASQLKEADELISGYRLSKERGEVIPYQQGQPAFCWDSISDIDTRIAENEFQLLAASLEDLNIESVIGGKCLSIKPCFDVSYKTSAFAAQLGEIRLVNSQRFVTDQEGNRHDLLNTDEAPGPVLYLQNAEDNSIIRQCSDWQSFDTTAQYRFDYRISQPLSTHLLNVPVHSITVLEQYTSYFMQRPVTATPEQSVWVPAYGPITWGWSMRVEPERDDWVITRRKLIPPVVGHDGWQMPEWQGNTEDYRRG